MYLPGGRASQAEKTIRTKVLKHGNLLLFHDTAII